MSIVSQCIAVVASLCINQSSSADITYEGSWSGAQITFATGDVTAVWYSDSIPFPDRSRMNKSCIEGGCVFYHRFCETSERGVSCTISFNELWWDYNRSFIINSPTMEEMNQLESSLRLVVGGSYLLPLGMLSETSEDAIPPHCRPSDDPECN